MFAEARRDAWIRRIVATYVEDREWLAAWAPRAETAAKVAELEREVRATLSGAPRLDLARSRAALEAAGLGDLIGDPAT